MRTKEQYIESLHKMKPNLYFNGEKIGRDHPVLQPSHNVMGVTFDAAHECRLISQGGRHVKIHGDIRKGCLKADPGWYINVENKLLECLLNFPVVQLVKTNEGRQQGIKIG